MKREIHELKFENITIMIGVTASDDYDYNRTIKFFKEIVEKDVNQYCDKLGYDIKFRFVIRNNRELGAVALENLIYFKKIGIDIVIGHPWSSRTYISISYMEANNMLLFSPSASSLQLKRIGDNLFRMCPDDTAQVNVIIEIIKSYGIKAIVVLYKQNIYGINLYKVLKKKFLSNGGIIVKQISVNLFRNNISEYLDEAEISAEEAKTKYGYNYVAILAIGTGAFKSIIQYVKNYPTLYNLTWFGSHYMAKNQAFIEEIPDLAAKLKILSPLSAPSESPLYYSLNEKYYALFSEPLDFEMTNRYDAAFIIVKAILIAQTIKVEQLLEVIPEVASMTFGVSGLCRLDDA